MADDYERRKDFFKDIELLSRPEQEELFRILRHEGGEYSENSNGIFFDITSLPDHVFNALWKFIQFCKTNAKDLEQRKKLIHDMANEPKVSETTTN